jgi:hypothetical protein
MLESMTLLVAASETGDLVKRHLRWAVAVSLALGVTLAACTSGSSGTSGARGASGPALAGHWVPFRHVPGVVDLAGPRGDGSFAVAAAGRLLTLSRTGALTPFARGPGGYSTAIGPEPYITLAGNDRVAGTSCSFRSDMIFALQPGAHPSVVLISADGRAKRFVSLAAGSALSGIAFDSTGRFGHRLLVTARHSGQTSVLAIDCAGGVRTITTHAPGMEGGIAVAPASFGRYGGDLIGPNESTGQVFAVAPDGTAVTLAVSGLPHGGDIGVESAGFVPPGFGPGDAAYLADRYSRGNKHPGTDSILRLPGQELVKAGVRAGDLLVATEASAKTIVVRCASSCTVRYIAIGPAITHGEGHIVFTRPAG